MGLFLNYAKIYNVFDITDTEPDFMNYILFLYE